MQLDVMELLHEAGANLELMNAKGYTALLVAVAHGQVSRIDARRCTTVRRA